MQVVSDKFWLPYQLKLFLYLISQQSKQLIPVQDNFSYADNKWYGVKMFANACRYFIFLHIKFCSIYNYLNFYDF